LRERGRFGIIPGDPPRGGDGVVERARLENE
jgi:hypothetical protein